MRCLIDYIGIFGAPGQTPESGEYINRLIPGLPMESIVKVTEADQGTFLEAWADIQNRAAKRFNTRVINEAAKRYQIRNIQASVDLLKKIDATNVTSSTAKWRGGTIELTPDKSQLVVYSAFQCIYIQELRLYRTGATAAVDGAIFDEYTGEKLFEFEIPLTTAAGWTRIKIERRFQSLRLFFAYDATLVDGVELSIIPAIASSFNSCACEIYGDGGYATIKGAQSLTLSDEVTADDLDTGTNTYGLSAVFSIQCSYEPLICQNRAVFLLAWAYLLAWEILWTRINSSTINRWTIGIDRKKAETQMAEIDALFENEMATTFDGIQLNLDDSCLGCNAPITQQYSRL